MTAPTRTERLLNRLRENAILAVVIVMAGAVVGLGAVLDAGEAIANLVRPARQASIANVLLGRGAEDRQYQITLSNPTAEPIVIRHVRIREQSYDSAFAAAQERGGNVLCAPGPIYEVVSEVHLSSNTNGLRFIGSIVTHNTEMADYRLLASGRVSEECGGASKTLEIDFDATVELNPGAAGSFFIRVPNQFSLASDSVASIEIARNQSYRVEVELVTAGGQSLTFPE